MKHSQAKWKTWYHWSDCISIYANSFCQHDLCSTESIEWSLCEQNSYVSESLPNNPDIRYSAIWSISKVATTTCWILSSTKTLFWLFPAITVHKASLTTVAIRFEVLKGSQGLFWPSGLEWSLMHSEEPLILLFFFIILMWMRYFVSCWLKIKHNYHTHHKKRKISCLIYLMGSSIKANNLINFLWFI